VGLENAGMVDPPPKLPSGTCVKHRCSHGTSKLNALGKFTDDTLYKRHFYFVSVAIAQRESQFNCILEILLLTYRVTNLQTEKKARTFCDFSRCNCRQYVEQMLINKFSVNITYEKMNYSKKKIQVSYFVELRQ